MSYQEPPFCIQVEPTQGCNLQCTFCGINGIQEKPGNYKFMSVPTARTIADAIAGAGWNARIEFAMHGEPTMNPNMSAIISEFRKRLPKNQLMMLTNGGGLLKGGVVPNIINLFNAGLNVIGFDAYDSVKIRHKVMNAIGGEGGVYQDDDECKLDCGFHVYEYPANKTASPHKRWLHGTRAFVVIHDISTASGGTHATLNNHCGYGAPLSDRAAGKRCAKPFRELSVRWNGKIALCCNSFSGRYYCGDLKEDDLAELWNNEAFIVARKHLYHGMRTFTPCRGCDALSYRVGFLPDQKGKKELPRPTKKEQEWANRHGAERPLTREVIEVKLEEK